MAITLRNTKGAPLTHVEMDTNFNDLDTRIITLESSGSSVTISDTAPVSPEAGDLWWSSDEARLKVYYDDGSSSQWVDSVPVGATYSNSDVDTHLNTSTATVGQILSWDGSDYTWSNGGSPNEITDGTSTITTNMGAVTPLTTEAFLVTGSFIPDTNAAYDLGTAEYKWRDLYLSSATIYLGNATITSNEDDTVTLPANSRVGTATIPPTDLVVVPEVLTINVNSEGTGQNVPWLWTWQQSTLPFARLTIANVEQPSVPLYTEGTYELNNFAAVELHSGLTQTHGIKLKWINQAGNENNISWVTDQGTFTMSDPAINGGADTQVNRQLINVPATITPPALTPPTSTVYNITFNAGAFNYEFTGARTGTAPNLGPWYRGGTYTINIDAVGHPLYLTTDNGANFAAGTYFGEYTNGVTGSRTESGTLTITVPVDAPDTLFYQCGNHAGMRGTIEVKDLAVEVNDNGNYVVFAQHGQEGMFTRIELRPNPALSSQMCIVYDATSGKFVPQDLATYAENTPSFKNKIKEIAGTATLVIEEGAPVVSSVSFVESAEYLSYTNNKKGDISYVNDTNTIRVWNGTEWESTEVDLSNYYTIAQVDSAISNSIAGIVDAAPATLDTLNELAAALGDDANFATTVTNSIATKADISSVPTSLTDLSIVDGLPGQILKTDGAGNFSFINVGTIDGGLTITGGDLELINFGITESITTQSGTPTPTIDYDTSTGSIFWQIFPTQNWTANLTNFTLDNDRSKNVIIAVKQDATQYAPTALEIGGVPYVIKWANGYLPTPSLNSIAVFSFTCFNVAGTFHILGQMVEYL